MEALLRRPTKITPRVELNDKTGTYVISGRSIPIDAELFYAPIVKWLAELNNNSSVKLVRFSFRLDFFNIASSKRILHIMYKLADLQKSGKRVVINWMYEDYDEDMLEIGQDYETMIPTLQFNFESYVAADLPEPLAKFG